PGAPASCGSLSCSNIKCGNNEVCEMKDGSPVCAGSSKAGWIGKEFALTFLQNYLGSYDTPHLQLYIMAAQADAKVTVQVPSLYFKEEKTLKAGEATIIKLPGAAELADSKRSFNTVHIEASANVAVMSLSSKKNTADTSVIYPMSEWGTEYFVFTPTGSPGGTFKEFSVINGKESNQVVISPRASIRFEGRVYSAGRQMVIDLKPYENVQLLSEGDLSGTEVSAQQPIAVFSGHTCTWEFSKCNHVYEQLLPVSAWGSSFMVPPLSFQPKYDNVYIQASQPTKVTIKNGMQTQAVNLNSGQSMVVNYHYPGALHIEADHGIQVLLQYNGVRTNQGKIYDPFLVTILPPNRFCSSYSFEALAGYENKVLIVAQTSAVPFLHMDSKPLLSDVQWKQIASTDYSWTEIQVTDAHSHVVVLVNYFLSAVNQNLFIFPGSGPVSCSNVKCGNNEVCEMKRGSPVCVPKPGTCWAMGDPHYRTFDGRRYDFMGTCTYVIAKKCSEDKDLEDFEVLAQNENRGNLRVSYVGLVIVKVYGITVGVVRSERGRVRVHNSVWTLPATLNDGKLKMFQSGRSVVIETEFGLTVRYDWEQNLHVTLCGCYAGKTCGLCGNFNGKPDDDFSTPSGTPASTVAAFGGSWKVPGPADNKKCKDDCVGGCESCKHGMMKTWEGDSYCGLIKLKDGPFSKCHATIDPQVYVDNCQYDLCMGGGLRQFLCTALETYAQACQVTGIQVQDWRTKARCPPKCPRNSHYELCGSACPATCSDPDAPSKCKRPCVETCTCDEGFVLSGDKCIPSAKCGCTHEGRYIPAGETFWADNDCKRLCKCVGESRRVECQDKGCGAEQKCQVVDGIRKCQALSFSTCKGTGDPHYVTFDKAKFDFQGTCVYKLAALCSENPDLVPFEVLVQNEHRNSKVVAFTKLVEVKVYSTSIIITKTHRGLILVNYELENLPVTLNDGKINVFKNGFYAVVTTDFGLKVTFNWGTAVFVTIPSNYKGAVCGLCGNYNGDKKDDLIPKNGDKPVSGEDFGASWRVSEIPGCIEGCKGACPDCDAHEKVKYEGKDFCGILTDPKGPFRDCHAKIDPAAFFEDCVYDVCLYRGRRNILCEAIAAYTSACQDEGHEVYNWRSSEFCAVKCPANSHYEICPTGCPATCKTLAPPRGCSARCQEGCVCDEDHILSGNLCVPFSHCGCLYNDRYYTVGQTFFPNGKCEEECKCTQGGEVACKTFTCGPNEECKIADGIQKCHPKGKGVCVASGDPHYTSLDGRKFDFQGTCTYTLSKSSGLEGTRLIPFTVTVENTPWERNKRVSVTKLVAVEVYNLTLTLSFKTPGVNGLLNQLPFSHNNGEVQIYQEGRNYVISTNFGLRVTYDLIYHVTVTVPGNYREKVSGLCGNFNGDQKDDFLMPNNKIATGVNEFGKSWKVTIPSVVCEDGCEGKNCPDCDATRRAAFSQNSYCGIISAPNGPFAACHSKLDPQPYFDDCVFDVCASNGDSKILCDSVAAYAFNCHLAGVDVNSWRTPAFCPMTCPANSHYDVCARPCADSCPGLSDVVACPDKCTEGCECNAGFIFNGQTCLKETECGCYDNGRTYKPGEVVFGEDCRKKCTCDPRKGVVCEEHTCPQNTKCMVKNGIRACYNADPCKDANCRVKEKCVVQEGRAVCIPLYIGKCWAWGDPHYHTFDGHNYDFQGTCKYVISKTSGKLGGLVPFSITERNDNRGNTVVSYVREVHVSVYDYTITIQKNQVGHVTVNEELLSLPVTLADGKVSVSQRGNTAQVETDFGLIVTYDWNWHLIIKLPSSYHGLVAGLCGNFNGKKDDELQNPAGEPVSSVAEWGKSWRTPDQDGDKRCSDACEKDCPSCDKDSRKLYESEAFCGAFNDKKLKKCHKKVDPQPFMENCLYDMCLTKGDRKMLCEALASYVEQCREEGKMIKKWRKKFSCLNCQRHSHYEACASPCQPSCPFPEEKQICSAVCVEACVCDDGYVLSAGVCVPMKTCGCSYQGRYYKPGQRFWADEACTRLCECDTTRGTVTCREASCSAKETCTLVDGWRACRPVSHATCIASGDPHYRTFDNLRFDFQGTCVYQLVRLCSQKPGLVPFEVTVQNDNRGNKAVSYTKTVKFSIYNATLTISKEAPGQLNGELVSLPLDYNNELVAFLSSRAAVVKTVAGIVVSFDWHSKVRVTLPSTYQDAVCGLCGNYNGEAQDDLTMKNGQKAPNGAKLGESWKVAEVPGCSPACEGEKCKSCSESQRKVYESNEHCGIIGDKAGPFRDCHKKVDPTPFIEDCVFDVCLYNGRRGTLCDAVELYVSACQSEGINIHNWRTNDFCPMACPANSHYSMCATTCPATCAGFNAGSSCRAPCAEACVCDEGHLLSGHTCVPERDCGCSYNGKYYKKGDVSYPDDDCKERCVCEENGVMSCKKNKCRRGEICKLLNGVKGCHPEGQAKCVASGDPHYTSFDGQKFDFQGTCVYVLAKVCDDDKGRLTPFTVTQVSLKLSSYSYFPSSQVDDELLNLPLFLNDGRVRVTQEGRNIIVRTDFGLTVLYDTVYYVEVIVPSTYQRKMCGLCGNYNNKNKDDYRLPSGKKTTNIDEFGNAWAVDKPGNECGGCGEQCPECEPAKAALYRKPDSCGIISAPNGPFKACHSKVDPAAYVSDCVYDVCALGGNSETLCNSVQAYALACQHEGVQIQTWRSTSFCPLSCPPKSHYEVCANTCGATCASLTNPVACSKSCFEGCECDEGLVSNGQQCVTVDQCGCGHNGQYLKVGETVVDKDCTSQCSCQPSGEVKCKKLSCGSKEVCSVKDGVRGCHVAEGRCTVDQAGRLSSFDGLSGATGAHGAFEVASLCDEGSDLWFRVVVDVRACLAGAPPAAATLYVFFKEGTVTVNNEHVVWVRTVQAVTDLLVLVFFFLNHFCPFSYFPLSRKSVMRVTYSASQEVNVSIDKLLAGKTCGPCGNANNDVKDDLKTADGTTAADVAEVVASWRAKDFSRW
uniref:Fc fragment of IgG binding protein n=1 Tax=Salarias fasciatus TaxID=181472 RepID=A0A672F8Q3_SALFA